jgi:hypothetical protein
VGGTGAAQTKLLSGIAAPFTVMSSSTRALDRRLCENSVRKLRQCRFNSADAGQ